MSEPGTNPAEEKGTAARWPVLVLPGLAPDTVGNYLASLGLLSLAARRWATVRACWRDGQFVLINGPADLAALRVELVGIAEQRGWSGYSRSWRKAQMSDTQKKTAAATSRWRSQEAGEMEINLFQAHVALGDRLVFNPLFGSGGNAGRRNFAIGWQAAETALAKPNRRWTRQRLTDDLDSYLTGKPCECLGDFSAGSWFSAANKTYNSGTEKPFRDGQVTPWAMVLACEAFPLLQGGASRQLGVHRRAGGAFPFVTAPAAPGSAGEAGKSVGEVWLPVWHRPMSVAEAAALFGRGRAEVNGRGATTAAAFSAAVVQRGVDAGIDEFRRFVLIRTTSENTFESRLADTIPVRERGSTAQANAVGVALGLRDALPPDRKKGKRWIYAGLQGPVDRALVDIATRSGPETARALVDALIAALQGVDRNRNHRKHKVRFELLPAAWRESLIGEHEPVTPEISLALALASLRPTPTLTSNGSRQVTAPMLAYWLGAENRGSWWTIQEAVPLRRIWGGGGFVANAASVLQRRLAEERPDALPPFSGWARVGLGEIEALLECSLDETELTRWLFRFSLFAPGRLGEGPLKQASVNYTRGQGIRPALALFALFKPLFDAALIRGAIGATGPVGVGRASKIAALLARGDVDSAVQSARHAYHSVGIDLADCEGPFNLPEPVRLLAALLAPTRGAEVTRIFQRWRSPGKLNQPKEREK
jgi:CRISPR-associated protein Csx17